MDKDYLNNLFINEVKGALKSGGGSGGGGVIPTKLSEFENDLWYSKREEFLTLTKEDFVPWENPDGDMQYLYISSPKLDWLRNADDIAYELNMVYEGESVSISSDVVGGVLESDYTDDGLVCRWYYILDAPFEIVSGSDYKNWDEDISKDEFVVNLFDADCITELNLKIYKVESKKVPIEYCDTTEIERAIDALTEEVRDL